MEPPELELTADDLAQRKRIVGLEDADVRRIRQLGELLKPRAAELASVFFEHLTRFEEARPLLGRPELLDEAKALKRLHLESMFDGDYGITYANERVALGRLYGRAELPPRLFLGAYHALMQKIGEAVSDPARFASLEKLATFDIALIVDVLIASRERVIREQQLAIRELSTPTLKLRDRLLLMPVIGVVDAPRARLLTESMLRAIHRERARVVVMDVTGVINVDTTVAHHLFQTVSAARLMGARVIVSGLTEDVSQSLAVLGVDTRGLETVGDLQGALESAERSLVAA